MASVAELREAGQAALQANDADAGEAAYRALSARCPEDIHALIGLGFAARMRGQRGEARERFLEAAAMHPSHTWPLLEISAECGAMGLHDEAEAVLRRALDIDARDFHCLLGLGRLLRGRGEAGAAADIFRKAIEYHAAQASGHVELAETLAQLDRPEDALAALDAGAAVCAPAYPVLIARARLLPGAGRHADALAAFCGLAGDTALPAAARKDAAVAGSRIARGLSDARGAIALLEQAVELGGEDIALSCDLAGQYRAAGRLADAEAAYGCVLARAPANLSALGGLAIVRRQVGDCDEAFRLIGAALGHDPGNTWIRFELAMTLRAAGRTDEAGAVLELIEPESAIYTAARMSLGHMARARGAHHWAASYFEQAAMAAADKVDALCQIAAAQRAIGDFAAAASAVARVFAHAPDCWQGHLADGYVRRAGGDRGGALAAFRRAAAAAPMQVQPRVDIAAECGELGRDGDAALAIDAALRIDPRHEGALLQKAASLARCGGGDAALAIYADLRRERPANETAHIEAAQLLARRGEAGAALAILTAARRSCGGGSNVDLRRAAILRDAGFLDEAYEILVDVQARHRRELTPWCHLVAACIDLGRFEMAAAMLAAPPEAAGRDRARIAKLRAQLNKARWNLEAAIEDFDAAMAFDVADAQAVYERAKLKLITFDLDGARQDLQAHAGLRRMAARREGRSVNPSQTHVGQLCDEFMLEPGVLGELPALRAMNANGQVDGFGALVRQYPDSTAAATGLMIALRRSGQFDQTLAGGEAGGAARIPRRLTQFWNDTEPPADVHALMQSWHPADSGMDIEVFDDVAAAAYLRSRYGGVAARAFGMAAEPAQRADIFRLARLFREGGFFVDADDRARGGLAAAPAGATFFAHQEDLGSIGNNVLGAAAGHDAIEMALRDAVDATLRGDREIIWLSTGPGLLTRALARWLARQPAGDVAILTLAEMRGVAALHCHAAYKATGRAWLNAAFPARKKAVLF